MCLEKHEMAAISASVSTKNGATKGWPRRVHTLGGTGIDPQ
jgi:hypothetical protein